MGPSKTLSSIGNKEVPMLSNYSRPKKGFPSETLSDFGVSKNEVKAGNPQLSQASTIGLNQFGTTKPNSREIVK
tara:strand:+ start:236 stop:457 length:222 start_codon:yes stop_codon:yes gene_type:complete